MKRMSQAFNNCLTHIKKEEELYMYQKKRNSLITMILTLAVEARGMAKALMPAVRTKNP